MALLVWYPKCSTCQKAKKKLEELHVSVETRSIVEETPTVEELRAWMNKGGIELKQLYNVSGQLYKEWNMKEKRKQMSEEERKLFDGYPIENLWKKFCSHPVWTRAELMNSKPRDRKKLGSPVM